MKELFFSPVVKKLDDFLRQEGNFLQEKKKGFLSLRNSLEQLKLYPKESEDGAKNIDDVVRYAYEVEDFIDKLVVELENLRSNTKVNLSSRFGKGSINITGGKYLMNLYKLPIFHDIDSDVKQLRNKLGSIQNKEVPVLGEEISHPTVPEKPLPSEFCPSELQSLLLSSEPADRLLIAVVGMGGLGKTFCDESSKKRFAWVHVSKDYKIPNLLRKLIEAFNFNEDSTLEKELDMMETEELGLYLYESLVECSYVVELDDVRDSEVWAHLRRALPNNKLGSRVVITTCIRSSIDESGVERTQVYEHPDSMATLKPEISPILDLSFDDLHHHLKLCYLYLGLFPENFEIKVDKLVLLWVAEGFIKSAKGSTLEEVAMDYVNELVDRSLIQIEKWNATRISTIRVHRYLRALLSKKSNELKLPYDFDDKNTSHTICGWFRRVASHCGFIKDFTPDEKTRTVMVFSKEDDTVAKLSKVESLSILSLLQVLDLEGTWFSASRATGKTTLPDVVGDLVLLRYLGLNDTFIDDLPPSIKTLRALQTLHVDRDILVSIPNEINELKRLRHFFGRLKWPFEVKNLIELQTLGYIEVVGRWRFNASELLNLRELYVDLRGSWSSDLEPISRLTALQSLCLKLDGFVDLQDLSKCGNLLQLKLKGRSGRLPDNMHEIFPNLKYLYIGWNTIHLTDLAKLPKLTILDFYRCYIPTDEFKEVESFPQLEILQLIKCDLGNLTFSDTTMPLLKELRITPENKKISRSPRLASLSAPKNWRHPNDDDWPYYPRTMP